MARLQIERGPELAHRVGHAIDARVHGSERVARIRPAGHPRRDQLELLRRAPEIAGLVQRKRQLVVREHVLGLQRDRFRERRRRARVLPLPGVGDAELQLRERNARLRRRHPLE